MLFKFIDDLLHYSRLKTTIKRMEGQIDLTNEPEYEPVAAQNDTTVPKEGPSAAQGIVGTEDKKIYLRSFSMYENEGQLDIAINYGKEEDSAHEEEEETFYDEIALKAEPIWGKIAEDQLKEVTYNWLKKWCIDERSDRLLTYSSHLLDYELRKKYGEGVLARAEFLPDEDWVNDIATEDLMATYVGEGRYAPWIKMCCAPWCRTTELKHSAKLKHLILNETAYCTECKSNTMCLATAVAGDIHTIALIPCFRFAIREPCTCSEIHNNHRNYVH